MKFKNQQQKSWKCYVLWSHYWAKLFTHKMLKHIKTKGQNEPQHWTSGGILGRIVRVERQR